MGKKKRGHPDLEEVLSRPWCYYCERDFDDLKILISHQKAKHFKCDRCGRRLNTAGGLSVHMSQVHKESLSEVDNALPNRSGLDVEIFGMEGVPEDVVQAHNQRVMTQYHQAEADRRAVTGNPAPGAAGTQQKKPKLESATSLKQRLAEHKAKQAAAASGGSSGDVTPVGAGQAAQTGAGYPQQQQYPTTTQQPANGSAQPQVPYPQPYGQPGAPYQTSTASFQSPGYASPGYQPYPAAGQQFQTSHFSNSPMSPSQYQPGVSPLPQHGNTPPLSFQHQQQQPMRTHTPPQTSTFPPRPPSLPTAPGLPQRPSFGAPHVNPYQMQQMHHAQVPVPPTRTTPYGTDSSPNGRSYSPAQTGAAVDDLISGAAKQADEQAGKTPQSNQTPKPEEAPAGEKAAKKEKSKPTRLVYSETEISPEEKMARLPRYAYVPENKEETVLGDATTAAVAGLVQSSEDIVNPPA